MTRPRLELIEQHRTPDRVVDLPDGSWMSIRSRPSGDGWIILQDRERSTVWTRRRPVWRPAHNLARQHDTAPAGRRQPKEEAMNTTKDPWERDMALLTRWKDAFDPEEQRALLAFLNYLNGVEWDRARHVAPLDDDIPF